MGTAQQTIRGGVALASQTNYIPWIIGGLVVIVALFFIGKE
jgi:hypothetical protein